MPEYGKSIDITRTNIGSHVTEIASAKAAQTAIGSRSGSASSALVRNGSSMNSTKEQIHPGSRAGLNNSKSAYLQMRNSGYMNASNQIARNRKNPPIPKPEIKTFDIKANSMPKMFDHRLTSSASSSISRLSKILR